MWPDFVNIKKRVETETPFLAGHLSGPSPLVFDACLGCGATTIGLRLKKAAEVLPNEIDPNMLDIAVSEARKKGLRINALSYDWRDIPEHLHGMFNMVTCLGNSITLLFDRNERLLALRNFASILVPTGALVIDERNYPSILEGKFNPSGKFVYCGLDKVVPRLVRASDASVVMEYKHLGSGDIAQLEMYPFKKGELLGLLHEAGFNRIRTFGDYKAEYDPGNVEFFTYVARKE
jgi:SAM-dependent methyltransferase